MGIERETQLIFGIVPISYVPMTYIHPFLTGKV